jgi:hypothetical protein
MRCVGANWIRLEHFRLMFMSICFIRFVFLFLLGWFCCFLGVNFIINDLVYFVEWNIITVNGRSVVIMFLFDWISLLFVGFDFKTGISGDRQRAYRHEPLSSGTRQGISRASEWV